MKSGFVFKCVWEWSVTCSLLVPLPSQRSDHTSLRAGQRLEQRPCWEVGALPRHPAVKEVQGRQPVAVRLRAVASVPRGAPRSQTLLWSCRIAGFHWDLNSQQTVDWLGTNVMIWDCRCMFRWVCFVFLFSPETDILRKTLGFLNVLGRAMKTFPSCNHLFL